MVNIVIDPWSASQNNKRSRIEPNSPYIVEEDEDAQHERKLTKALDVIDMIRESNLESDNVDDDDSHIHDASIAEEIPSQPK